MLRNTLQSKPTDAVIEQYLHDTLGLRVDLAPWTGVGSLPYFLQDAFAFRQLALHGHPLLLALEQRHTPPKGSELRAQVERIRTEVRMPVIYVTDSLASYERKRLVELRVPFLVPGNQMYLPDLGIDLREYFRQIRTNVSDPMSPATQAVFITMLLSKTWQNDWAPAEIVSRLGYTPMTLTRVVRELAALELAEVTRHGRERHLHITGTPRDLWERARKTMRSPVRRSVWVQTDSRKMAPTQLAGLSALARLTQLADPPWSVYAVGPSEWPTTKPDGDKLLPHPADGYSEWQVWTYSPTLVPGTHLVDPLSLALSLEQEADERVRMALDELRSILPW